MTVLHRLRRGLQAMSVAGEQVKIPQSQFKKAEQFYIEGVKKVSL